MCQVFSLIYLSRVVNDILKIKPQEISAVVLLRPTRFVFCGLCFFSKQHKLHPNSLVFLSLYLLMPDVQYDQQ